MKPPFEMITDTDLEQWRYDTFWEKEFETIAWIKSFKNNDVFFDVGANIGLYSFYCATLWPDNLVIAFEPHEQNFNRMLDNIRLNDFTRRIIPYRLMIGAETAKKSFKSDSTAIGSSGGQMCEPGADCCDLCRSIDDLIWFSFSFPTPNHVKIDIDGQELEVIKGMAKTLPLIDSLLVEVSSNSKAGVVDILTRAGFTMDNKFNTMSPHSRERREKDGIDAENIVFLRG
jgi:FkbM family methyltransferase